MNICEVDKSSENTLEQFKSKEYVFSDKEHYGDAHLDFTPKEFTFLMKEGEEILGFITFVIKAGITYIDGLLVGNEHRRRGIGQKLVIAAEDKARELGSHKIQLETGNDWTAKTFYEKLGYSVRTILPNDIAHLECVLMDKML